MSEEKLIKIGLEEDDIVIRISKDDLIFLAESCPEARYKVIDKEKYVNLFVRTLQNYCSQQETGSNAIEDVFDAVITETYVDDCEESIIDEWDEWHRRIVQGNLLDSEDE